MVKESISCGKTHLALDSCKYDYLLRSVPPKGFIPTNKLLPDSDNSGKIGQTNFRSVTEAKLVSLESITALTQHATSDRDTMQFAVELGFPSAMVFIIHRSIET